MTEQLDRETELRRRFHLGPGAPAVEPAAVTPLDVETARLRALVRRFKLDASEDTIRQLARKHLGV